MDTLGPYALGPNETHEMGVYCGDALHLMRSIPHGCVDVVFTSPPYNAGRPYEGWDDAMSVPAFWAFQTDWVREAYRVTSDRGRLYAMVSDDMVAPMAHVVVEQGWVFHQLLTWCKPNMAKGGVINKDWNTMTETCLLCHRGTRTPMLDGGLDVLTRNWVVATAVQTSYGGMNARVHPAQMAFKVAYEWLARTPGQVVLDPFLGSGTTALAAKALGRRWLGFDIGPQTVALARDRLRNGVARAPGQLVLEGVGIGAE